MSDLYRKKYEENQEEQELTKPTKKKNRKKLKISFSKDVLQKTNDGDTFKDDKSTGNESSEENREQRKKYPTDEKKATKSCMKLISLPSSSCTDHTDEVREDKGKKPTDDKEESTKDKICSLQRRKHIITPLLGRRGSQLIQLANSYNDVSCQIDSEEKKVELANLSRKEHEIARQNYEAACEAAQKAREEKVEKAIKEKQALLVREKTEHAEQVKKAKEELAKKEAEHKEIRKKIYNQALAKAEQAKAAKEKRLALKKKREEEWAKRLLHKDQSMQEKKHDIMFQTRPTQVNKASQYSHKQRSQRLSNERTQIQLSQTSSKSPKLQTPAMVLTPPDPSQSLTNLEVVQLTSPKGEISNVSAITSPIDIIESSPKSLTSKQVIVASTTAKGEKSKESAITSPVNYMESSAKRSPQSFSTQSKTLSPEGLTSEQVKVTSTTAKGENSKESAMTAKTSTATGTSLEESLQSVPTQSEVLSHRSLTSEQVKVTPSTANRIRNSLKNVVRKVKPEKFPRILLESSVEPARSSSEAEGRLKPRRWPKFRRRDLG